MIFKISWSIFPGLDSSWVSAQLFLYVGRVGEHCQFTKAWAWLSAGHCMEMLLPSFLLLHLRVSGELQMCSPDLYLYASTCCKIFILSCDPFKLQKS